MRRRMHRGHSPEQFAEMHAARLQAFGGFRPPFGSHGHGRGRGRGRGARRGDVRAGILALLAERPMHGYEMIQELDARTGGVWRPSPGSVYPTLQLLEDEGHITSEETGGRKRFTLTEAGRAEAAQQKRAPWDEITDDAGEAAINARAVLWGLAQASRDVMTSGTPEQQARALELLAETRRKLYAILAEEDE